MEKKNISYFKIDKKLSISCSIMDFPKCQSAAYFSVVNVTLSFYPVKCRSIIVIYYIFFYMIAAYDFMLHQICLKYFPVPSTYSSVKLSCDA